MTVKIVCEWWFAAPNNWKQSTFILKLTHLMHLWIMKTLHPQTDTSKLLYIIMKFFHAYICQWRSQKILIGEADFGIVFCCGDCSIRVRDCSIRVSRSCYTIFLLSGDARTLTDVWSSVSFTNFKCSMHPTVPMLAF